MLIDWDFWEKVCFADPIARLPILTVTSGQHAHTVSLGPSEHVLRL